MAVEGGGGVEAEPVVEVEKAGLQVADILQRLGVNLLRDIKQERIKEQMI